ncbi:MAG: ABC transporter permease [Bacteroidetes bacterium]|nr:ABC transporter permease [Bacteroidota bacterium]MCW5897139.1 ABC transporter permease [Bacteroidota bacterium]
MFRIVIKNALRHVLRSSLTILGIAIAVIAFCLLRTVVTVWYSGIEVSAANRLITRQAVSFIFPLPYAYRDQIGRVDGVEQVSFANWFGGTYIDKKQFFARLAVDHETFFDVYPEFLISPEELQAFKRERNACVVGEDLVKRYGFKNGDIIQIEGDIFPGQWQFVVRGVYRPREPAIDPSNFLFRWDYLDERLRQDSPTRAGYVGWYIVKTKDAAATAQVSQSIDNLFANSRAETKTETERQFQQGFIAAFSAVIDAMNFISFVIIGIIMLVLGNTMIMSSRERTREYAVLKTIGFSGRQLLIMIAGESLLIAALGGLLGLLATFPSITFFQALMPKGFFPVFFIEPITIVLAVTAAILVGVVAAIFPVHRTLRTKIVEGLRFIG